MFPQFSNFQETQEVERRTDKSLSAEQFEQIVKAIIEGKYSWACVLMLRFGGYNPMHYIPYRTYKRLIRDNKIEHTESRKNFHRDDALNYSHSHFH